MPTYVEPEKRLGQSFWALVVSQFLGAMNDNAYRWMMALALISKFTYELDEAGNLMEVSWPVFVGGAVMAAPYILFSAAAGVVADRVGKRRMIVWMNLAEVLVMVLGLLAFLGDSALLCFMVLFLMLTQSAFFSPAKYGIIPELVPRERLSYANGVINATTNIAIILGTVGGTVLFKLWGAPEGVARASMTGSARASIIFIVVAAIGWLFSIRIRDTGVRSDEVKTASMWFWQDIRRNLKSVRGNRYLHLTLYAIGFFLFLGAYVQQNVTPYGINILNLSKAMSPNLFLLSAFGIGIGSFIAGKVSGRSIEIGLVPVGAGIVAGTLLLFFFPFAQTVWVSFPLFFLLGMGGGLYIVPLNAYVQHAAPEHERGEVIATSNFLSFCGMGLAAVLLLILQTVLRVDAALSFVFLGAITLVLTIIVVRVLPDFLIRFVGLIVTRILYRLTIIGRDNVPLEGGALLVGNHVSYVDAALVGATHQRRIRFLMAREYYNHPWFNWLFKLMRTIPVDQRDNPRDIVRALKEARKAIEDGYLVCIFAEGELTRTGAIMEFKRGMERIVQGTGCPIIPVCLHGIWGSTFSYREGMPLKRFPRRWGRRVSVAFGEPLGEYTEAFQVRQSVMELQSEAYMRDRDHHEPLPIEFARSARSHWRQPTMSDTLGREATAGRALVSAVVLSDALRDELKNDRAVGLILPTAVAGSVANIAVSFLGKITVNLNYTASPEALDSAIEQAGIRHVVTSKRFLSKLDERYKELPGLIYLEDVAKNINAFSKIRAFLKARFLPVKMLTPVRNINDVATILFSSGSTGKPKGVMLTHYNLLSNIESLHQLFNFNSNDVLCGSLPFFHAFGYSVTVWLPPVLGVGVAYHPNPLESAKIGKMVDERNCSYLIATPTFLLGYIRKVEKEQFASLKFVITGAEKLQPRIASAFEEKFGIEPMEGYGATELSPVAGLNVRDVEAGGVAQVGHRPGTIGRPIPGVTMRVVDPENYDKDLGYDTEGLLLVKGPNVMKGYLKQPGLTAEAIHEGWYVTGDMARISHDGFVQLTGRMSRFSKIGGEMVPHIAIEEKIQELLEKTEPVCAVSSVADEKRGERIVVLLTPDAGDADALHKMLRESDLPNLYVPSRKDIHQIDELPLLGSGKLDLKAIKAKAEELSGKGGE